MCGVDWEKSTRKREIVREGECVCKREREREGDRDREGESGLY